MPRSLGSCSSSLPRWSSTTSFPVTDERVPRDVDGSARARPTVGSIVSDPRTVADHLASLAEDRRAGVEAIRRAVAAAAPEAVESIAYGMPAFRSHGGRFLVSFA